MVIADSIFLPLLKIKIVSNNKNLQIQVKFT